MLCYLETLSNAVYLNPPRKKESGENNVLLLGTKNIYPQDADVERLLSGGNAETHQTTLNGLAHHSSSLNCRRTKKERKRKGERWRQNVRFITTDPDREENGGVIQTLTTRNNYSIDIIRQRQRTRYLMKKTDKTYRLNYQFAASIVIARVLMLKGEKEGANAKQGSWEGAP